MEILVVTQQEAKEMREAISLLEQTEAQTTKAQFDIEMVKANVWYNTIEKPISTTRQEALDKFNHIKSLLETETDDLRLRLLRKKLFEANEKYIEVKASV